MKPMNVCLDEYLLRHSPYAYPWDVHSMTDIISTQAEGIRIWGWPHIDMVSLISSPVEKTIEKQKVLNEV